MASPKKPQKTKQDAYGPRLAALSSGLEKMTRDIGQVCIVLDDHYYLLRQILNFLYKDEDWRRYSDPQDEYR